MAYKRQLFDGSKSISLDSLSAWSDLGENLPWATAGTSTHSPLRLYATVAYLYRCIEVRSNALLAMPWSIYRGDTELVRHDVDEWPKELAAYQGLEELLWQTEAALCLTSEAFWYKRRSRLGPIAIRWLDPSTMTPVWGVDAITAFKRQVGNATSELSPEDIVYTRLAGISETTPRTAPAAAAMSAAGVLYNVNEFAAAFFKRGAIKATLLTVEGNPPQAERERLKAWWQRFFTGINKAFAAEVVSAAVTPVVVGEGLSELTNTELTATEREEIATALGVPHSLVMSNAANFATAEADRLTFYDMTVVPEANSIARQVNAQLFAPAGMRFEWHPQELTIYQADENSRAAAFAAYVNAGIKPSIVAQMLGLQLPEGVEPEDLDPEPQPVQLQQAAQDAAGTQGAQDAQGNAQQAQQDTAQGGAQPEALRANEARKFLRWAKGKRAPDVAAFASDVLTDDDKRALLIEHTDISTLEGWQAYKALMLTHDPGDDNSDEERMLLEIEARAQRDIAKALRAQFRDLLPPNAEDMDIVELQAYLEQRLSSQAVHDAINATVRRAVDAGVNLAADQLTTLGVGFDYTMIHTAAREWAQQYSAELIQGIDSTTQTAVRESVARWYTNGEPLSALTRDLSSVFDERRARLIAMTETTNSAAQGTLRGYEASGVVTAMVWLTASDELVCGVCGALNGKVVDLKGKFSDTLPPELQRKLGARAFATPPAHPGCILPGNEVVIPGALNAATQSFYNGRCVEVTFSDGRKIAVTKNHPILTPRGWVQAQFISEGDYVLGTRQAERIATGVKPDYKHVPTAIEDVFGALKKSGGVSTVSVPASPENFHGDGRDIHGNIDIVFPDGFMLGDGQAAISQYVGESSFDYGTVGDVVLSGGSLSSAQVETLGFTTNGSVGVSSHTNTLVVGRHLPTCNHSGAAIARSDAMLEQALTEGRATHTSLSREFLLRFTSDITTDKVINVRTFDYLGHVYDLQSNDYELYICNGVLVKNCRCRIGAQVIEVGDNNG